MEVLNLASRWKQLTEKSLSTTIPHARRLSCEELYSKEGGLGYTCLSHLKAGLRNKRGFDNYVLTLFKEGQTGEFLLRGSTEQASL